MKIKAAIGYIDLQAALLAFFVLLVGIMFTQIKIVEDTSGNLNQKADILITMDWQDNSTDDIDLWVKGPKGEVLFYGNRLAGAMTLDQDERGINSLVSYRQEVASIRGREPGIYTVQAMMFDRRSGDPTVVNVHLIQVNPRYAKMGDVTLTMIVPYTKDVAFKFSVAEDGTVTMLDSSEKDRF